MPVFSVNTAQLIVNIPLEQMCDVAKEIYNDVSKQIFIFRLVCVESSGKIGQRTPIYNVSPIWNF